MKNQGRYFLRLSAIIFLSPFCVSCASGIALYKAKQQLKQGDSAGAVIYAAESVREDAKNYDAVDYLVSIYPEAVEKLKQAVDEADRSASKYHLEDLVGTLSSLHAMYDAVSRLPPVFRKKSAVPVSFPVSYQRDRLAEAKGGAADLRYSEGLAFSAKGSRKSWRDAHKSFLKTMVYVPGYRDAEIKSREARELGSDSILVLPFNAGSNASISLDLAPLVNTGNLSAFVGQYLSMLAGGEGFAPELGTIVYSTYMSTLVASASRQDYVRVVERSQIEAMLGERELAVSALADGRVKLDSQGIQGANIIVFGQLTGVVPEGPSQSAKTVYLQAVVEQPIPGALPVNGIVPVEKVTIFVTVLVHTKTSSLTASVALRAVNAENSILIDAVSRTQTIRDTVEWAEYSGDKRALGGIYLNLVDKREEQIRSPREMMAELAKTLVAPAVGSLLAKLPIE